MLEKIIKEYGGKEVSAMEVYREMFRLGEGLIQKEGEEKGEYKANPILYYKNKKEKRGKYRILFEDTFEEVLREGQEADFCILNGLTYFGRKNVQTHASKMYAMIFDIDGITDQFLENMLHGCYTEYADRDKLYPLPNYIILSGHNLHLYYLFEEPIPLYPNMKLQLKELKYALIELLWNRNTSNIEKQQYQGINQGFRPVGGRSKIKGVSVRAFLMNTHPYSLEYFNQYVPKEKAIDSSKLFKESKYTLLDAKEKFPKWYEKVVLNKNYSVEKWDIKGKVHGDNPYALYDWWYKKIKTGAIFGHRYFCIMLLAVYAVKNGVEFQRLKQDAYGLIPAFNTINPKEPFTKEDVDSALECYDERYCTFPLRDIEKLSSIPIERNKRNGLKQKQHLYLARRRKEDMKAIELPMKAPEGRPNKENIIKEWRKANPDGKKMDCHRSTGLSRTTIDKWW